MKFFQQIWATPKVHGLIQAMGSAVVGAVLPFVMAFYTYVSNPAGVTYQVPSLKSVVGAAVCAALSGGIGYAIKQGWLGSSNITPPAAK